MTTAQVYYIEDGVHRAVAARQNGLRWVTAIVFEPRQRPARILVELSQLYSPRAAISRSDPRHNFNALEAAMATAIGRSRIPPIHVQPLGIAGQSASIPLAKVRILP